MRRLFTWIVSGVVLIGLFLAISPLIVGIYLERYYQQLIADFSANSHIQMVLTSYQRGWFHSKAILSIKIMNPSWLIKSNNVATEVTLQQTIRHGPLLFQPPYLFGWAAIQNRPYNNENVITFDGAYFTQFKIPNFKLFKEMGFQEVSGQLWIWPHKARFRGHVSFLQMKLADKENQLTIPSLAFSFDFSESAHHLWLGESSITIPEIDWQTVGHFLFILHQIKIENELHEDQGLLAGHHALDIQTMDIENETIGPVKFFLQYQKLNAEAIDQLLVGYQTIKQRGELYQSQLKQKMLMLLPNMIGTGSKMALDELSLKTNAGTFKVNGEVAWPYKNEVPDDLEDFLKRASMKMEMQISKKLFEKVIQLLANFVLFNQNGENGFDALTKARVEADTVSRLNAYYLEELVRLGLLFEKDALLLEDLQKQVVPMEDYLFAIKQLLLEKNISLTTSYQLGLQYGEIERPFRLLNLQMQQNQAEVAADAQTFLAQGLKKGYIKQDAENYRMTLKQP